MKIFDLFDIPAKYLPLVGGKARGLYLLHKAGLPVAKGFVVVNACAADAAVAETAYESRGFDKVAVRSSASNEDGEVLSGAGQYETVLNVHGKADFISAFNTCAESFYGSRAQAYQDALSVERGGSVNVVVQEMVDAVTAGVGFSFNPDDHGILIEAVHGLGESLVSGTEKSVRYSFSRTETDRRYKDDGYLTAAVQNEIVEGLLLAETALGAKADCEWAVGRDGKLVWLQARPITVTDVPDIDEFNPKHDLTGRVLTTCNVGEMLPGAVTPLSITTSILALDYGIRRMFSVAGVIKKPEDLPEFSCIASIKGHLFIDLTTMYPVADNVMMASKPSIDLSVCGRELGLSDGQTTKKVSFFKKFINGIRYFGMLTGTEKAKKKLVRMANEFTFTAQGGIKEIYAEIDARLAPMCEAMWYHYNTTTHSGAMNGALNITLKGKIDNPEKIKAGVAGTLVGIDDIESVAILADLGEIAKAIKKSNPDREWSLDTLTDYLDTVGGEIRALLDKFLTRHGHRAIREAELRSKSWRDDKPALYGYILTVLSAEDVNRDKGTSDWRENVKKLSEPFGWGMKKGIKFLVGQCRKGVVNREFSKSYIVKIIDAFKQRYRLLADMLVKEGYLPDADCVYFLTHKEIGELVNGKNPALVKKSIARRRLLSEQEELVFPDVTVGMPQPVCPPAREDAEVLSGIPVSRGVAKGIARVVKSPEDAKKLQKGEIMVAKFTDIGWSPYYCLIDGLVTEIGSALSHGAVVAREYALPVVVNVPFATESIKTGDRISIDGTTGEIRFLSA